MNVYMKEKMKNRMPHFELSYESILHKKVPENYDVQLAIPSGKKYLCWFTFLEDEDVCIFMELNKERKIATMQKYDVKFPIKMAYNTLLYGVFLTDYNAFVIEDIHYYNGINTRLSTNGRLYYIKEFLESMESMENTIKFTVPVIRKYEGTTHKIDMFYPVHHYQYRSMSKICPYLNEPLQKEIKLESKIERPLYIPIRTDFRKPQYKHNAIFLVNADIKYDVYHLYAYGKQNSKVYYNIAYIPDYNTSVFMNNLFRNIKENKNLDYIEESDDEDDFQNINEDKYVNLNKQLSMECTFHYKFKKWIPKRIMRGRIVHISQL